MKLKTNSRKKQKNLHPSSNAFLLSQNVVKIAYLQIANFYFGHPVQCPFSNTEIEQNLNFGLWILVKWGNITVLEIY